MRKGISQKPKTLKRSRKPRANVSQQRHLKDSGTIALIILLSMAPPLATDMYMSSLPTIAEELSTTQALASQTMTVFFLFMALGTLFLGPLSDKYGRKRVLLISIGAMRCLVWGVS